MTYRVSYRDAEDTPLPGASATVTLYSTSESSPENLKDHAWFVCALKTDQAGTFKVYRKQSYAGAEVEIDSQAVSAGSEQIFETYIEPYAWIVVKFVNGSSEQGVFDVNQCFAKQRASAMLG